MENNKCEHCAKHKYRTEKEYKSLVKLKERSVKLNFAIDRYYYSLLKKELTSDYIYTVERILTRFMESIGKLYIRFSNIAKCRIGST